MKKSGQYGRLYLHVSLTMGKQIYYKNYVNAFDTDKIVLMLEDLEAKGVSFPKSVKS